MLYKRFSQHFWNYALLPADTNIDKDIIEKYGETNDYYCSIYSYPQEIYDTWTSGIKTACTEYNVKYDPNNILKTTKDLRQRMNKETDEVKKKKYKSLISIKGTTDIKTDKLVFDFDDKSNIERAKADTIDCVSRLITKGVPKDSIQLSFSGNKGYAVEVHLTSSLTRSEFENITINVAGDLPTFDYSVRDEQRLFRLPLTLHNSSGCYKIPLSIETLSEKTSNQIKAMAAQKLVEASLDSYYDIIEQWSPCDLPEALTALKTQIVSKAKSEAGISFDDKLDLSMKPTWMSEVKYALQQGFFREGERNTAFMILAATYRSHGFPKEITWRILKGVAELQSKRTGDEEYSEDDLWTQVIECVYDDSWRGGTYSEKDNEILRKTAERFGLRTLHEEKNRKLFAVEESITRFKHFAKSFSKNRIWTGIETLDKNICLTTGMMVGILGSPSSGKTSIANNIVKYISNSDEKVLYECLDMDENFTMARLSQQFCRYPFEKICEMLEDNNPTPELINAFEMVAKEFRNVHFNYVSSNIESIEEDIVEFSRIHGKGPRLVVVDYLEKVRGPYSDATANSGFVASRLSDLAKKYNCCVLLLLQPQKSAGDPREPLLSMRKVKGASIIEQDSRVIMTVWRPGFNPEDFSNDKYMSIAVVKNNMGSLGKYDFHWDGLKGKIRDLENEESFQLNNLLAKIASEKSTEDNSW